MKKETEKELDELDTVLDNEKPTEPPPEENNRDVTLVQRRNSSVHLWGGCLVFAAGDDHYSIHLSPDETRDFAEKLQESIRW